jgi:Zn-dependent protease
MEIFIKITCLLIAIVLHELAHGLAAYCFGDRTAKYAGRLSLNPISHVDPIGSIFLPLLLYFTHAPFLIGWAKPVPVNFMNLRPQHIGVFLVAFAGPLMNIFLALMAGVFWKMGIVGNDIANTAIQLNVILAAFNLLPILPLDGGRMITCFLPQHYKLFAFFDRFGLIIVIGILMLFGKQVHQIIFGIGNMILGFLNALL